MVCSTQNVLWIVKISLVLTAMTDSVAGENSDLFIQGQKIHIQTEDWGLSQKILVSRVFQNGSVMKTFKLPYEKIPQVELQSQRKMALAKLHEHTMNWVQKEI
jgi:predicted secreted protein